MTPTPVFLVAGIAVAVGALVQGGVGLGLGLIAAPVVTLLDPALMPGSMLVAGAALPVLILAREARFRRFLDAGRIRVAVLVTAAASATVLIAHSLVG
jgi:uncharacterized protein